MKKHKFKKGGNALIFGFIFSALSFFITFILFSFLLSTLKNPISLVAPVSLSALLLSGGISGFATAKYKGEGGTLAAILSSCIASAVIFAVGLITSGGKIQLSLLMNILCYLLVSALFAKFATLKKKRRRSH